MNPERKEGLPKRREPWDTAGEWVGIIKELPHRVESGVETRVKARVEDWDLLGREKTQLISWKLIGFNLRKIKLDREDPFPDVLKNPEGRAIVVSNYPSVSLALKGAMRFGAEVPGRLKGIGRQSVIDRANPFLTALGIGRGLVYPARKDEAGIYRLEKRALNEIMDFLDEPGSLLWMSLTGETNLNGLGEADVRTGAALFSLKKGIPLVPMGIVTKGEGRNLRAIRVRLGEPIPPPVLPESELDQPDYLVDYSKMLMAEVAKLLPPGQRGDFEDIDKKLSEARRRLRLSTQLSKTH